MIPYNQFFRLLGIRRVDQLLKPVLHSVNVLELPRGAILHYANNNMINHGISGNDPILRAYTKVILMENNTELGDQKGNPRTQPVIVSTLLRDYFLKNRHIRPLRKIEPALKDETTLILENYAMMPFLYRYMRTFFANYFRWYNIQAAIYKRMNEIAAITERQQYIQVELPPVLPEISNLVKGEVMLEPTRAVLEQVGDDDGLFILDMWTWLGEHRENSLMSRLDHNALSKINLVFTESGKWIIINLGLLDDWRKSAKGEVVERDAEGQVLPNRIQRIFYRAMLTLLEARTLAGAEVSTVAEAVQEEDAAGGNEQILDENGQIVPELNPDETLPVPVDTTSHDAELTITDFGDENDDDGLDDTEASIHETLKNLETDDAELKRLASMDAEEDMRELTVMSDRPAPKRDKVEDGTYKPAVNKPEDGVMAVAEQIAEAGLLSPAEYRRISTLAHRYKEIPNPYTGKGTLAESMIIKPSETKIITKHALIEGEVKGVLDKSMQNSSLELFDPIYIKNVLAKDVMQAVVGIQSAGIAVQSYSVEKIEDVNNEYELHSVRVVPVVGSASTLRFRLPVVSEDGTYKANGVKCFLRKQRVDVPIRKVSPSRVALTSYYAKTFIERSERKANNYPSWIVDQVTAIGINLEDPRVTEIALSDAFEHTEKLPRIYAILSTRLAGFTMGLIRFNLQYKQRYKAFGEERVRAIEKDGKLVVCAIAEKELVAVDYNNIFYAIDPNNIDKMEPLGTIESMLELDMARRPVEVAEVGIMGKPIPLGIVMAYEMGLTKLIKMLGVEPRRANVGERLNLTENEYAIHFSDEVLVFNNENKIAELILSGFNRYYRELKRYSVHEFDKKDVYQVVLDRNKLPVRFIREMDSMFKLFVDPITKELLEEMGEPTHLIGLYYRAAELLTTEYHPAMTDMNYMRDRGYERFAGAVYSEISRAVRVYKSRPATSAATVDLNPYAVWMNLMQDPASMPIKEQNPIDSLKEKEVVIFGGTGGRSSRSMTEKSRTFDKSSIGVVSEATVDNSDVATTTYLTADPNYVSVRGITRPVDPAKDGPASMVSTSMLLAPGADRDD